MSETLDTSPAANAPATEDDVPNSRLILSIIVCVQLMIAIDITVMNMALPRIQEALDFTPASLSWVLNAYTLAFGGLLLLGGRVGDILGHRRALVWGIGLFAAASLGGGLAQTAWFLLAMRVLQGVGGALAAPSTLALIVSNFKDPAQRAKAFGIFVMASGIGTAGGLLLGGLITQAISWRWVLLINVPVGVLLLIITPMFVAGTRGKSARFDIGGALTATIGVTAVAYGFVHAAEVGWGHALTIGSFVVGVVLLALFVAIEARHEQPILKLSVFADRNRSAGFLTFVCSGAAVFGRTFLLTQFVQEVLGLSPFVAGLAFLPSAVFMFIVPMQLTPFLVKRAGAKATMALGLAVLVVGMLWFVALSPSTEYWTGVFGPMTLAGVGVGLLNPPLTGAILATVAPQEAGVVSGVMQAVGMLGGAVGTAVLVTIFGFASRGTQVTPGSGPAEQAKEVLSHGVAMACLGGAIFAFVGMLIVLVFIRTPKRVAATAAG